MRSAVITGLGGVAAALGLLLVGLRLTQSVDYLDGLAARLEAADGVLLGWRMALIGALYISWPAIAERLGRWRQLDTRQLALLVRARARLALWLLVFELVVVQGTAARLFGRVLS